jgi:crotonobetaine/carnitine-CoA ligase
MYGLTEAFPVTVQPVADPPLPGGSGRPIPNFEVRLFDDNDADVPVGVPGEIVVRPTSPHSMFEGYAGLADQTLRQHRNLWFHTGDFARWDDSGELVFIDRKKDAIRRRGENISSFEIERAVLQHGAVAECAAVAVPSPLGEDDVKICVMLHAGAALTPSDLHRYCVDALPRFAVPRYIEMVDQLPKTVTGRVQKVKLRDDAAGGRTWDADHGP